MPHPSLLTGLTVLALAAPPEPVLSQHLQAHAAAKQAEAQLDLEVAAQACTLAIELLPSGPRAGACRERLLAFAARRDTDGGFAGWVELERARQEASQVGLEATAARMRGLLAREGLAVESRVEALLWLAGHQLDRRADPAGAEALLRTAYADRQALSARLRTRVTQRYAEALAALGRAEEAALVEAEVRVADHGAPRRTPVEQIAHEAQVERARRAAWGCAALFVAATARSAWRAPWSGLRPWGLGLVLAGLTGAWVLVSGWERGAGDALLWMAAPLAAVHLLSAAALREASGWWAALVRLLAAGATIAVGLLALHHTNTLSWVLP